MQPIKYCDSCRRHWRNNVISCHQANIIRQIFQRLHGNFDHDHVIHVRYAFLDTFILYIGLKPVSWKGIVKFVFSLTGVFYIGYWYWVLVDLSYCLSQTQLYCTRCHMIPEISELLLLLPRRNDDHGHYGF